jgi:hypothetical protein
MDQSEDPLELVTTVERLRAWIQESEADAPAASGGATHQASDQCARSGNLGTERMPCGPRLGVLGSSRV